ncbi:MAG: hypothetical protein MR008_02050 [Aerococcus sp.]|nr:hypothetical protein [Aerococcus sp.]
MLLNDYITTDRASYRLAVIKSFESQASVKRTFAIDDAILHQLDAKAFPADAVLHFWPCEPTVFLGMQDSRLPHFHDALAVLQDSAYVPLLRSAGGLAVVGDPEVMNVTLLFRAGNKRPSLDQGYQCLTDLVNQLLRPYHQHVTTGEVAASYCPGRYDLSIAGRKVAGLAQRRVGDAIGIYMYISLAGDQAARANLIKAFYARGKQGETTRIQYPDIDPEVMTTLETYVPALRALDSFSQQCVNTLVTLDEPYVNYMAAEQVDYGDYLLKEHQRNQRLLHKEEG